MKKNPDDFRLAPTDEEIQTLARRLYPAIRTYFDSEEGKRDFAAWKKGQAEKRVKGPDDTETSS
ncbi:hypothetical protein LJC32_00665 [Oscillospiraceae bacterium OttesenSCG-928-F05]|nr:hypothetical protein [Oscillospiraceae bacterium OttesenSCG-928-F05]